VLEDVVTSGNSSLHLTTAVSSPGRTRNRSPTCTMPLHIRPVTPMTELCPLKTFEIGNRRGDSMSRTGGSNLSRESLVKTATTEWDEGT